jgi:hypothetical protein
LPPSWLPLPPSPSSSGLSLLSSSSLSSAPPPSPLLTLVSADFEEKKVAVKVLTKQVDDEDFSAAFYEFRKEIFVMR